MASVTGKLENILEAVEKGSIVIALCGYGSQFPRVAGAELARVTTLDFNVNSDGTFSAGIPGNDQIVPSGTYYTITIKDANGDVVQTNAYLFQGDLTYDLDFTPPFDPSLPIMPLPPAIINELLILIATNAMIFDGTNYTTFKTTLHGNVLSPTFANMQPGNLYTFIILQDSTGGWGFDWGPTVHNGTMVGLLPNQQTTQTFVADVDGALFAIAPGTYYP